MENLGNNDTFDSDSFFKSLSSISYGLLKNPEMYEAVFVPVIQQ